jgi:glycine betaine/proline transport system permease protein
MAAGPDEVRGPAPKHSIALIGAVAPWVSPAAGLHRSVIVSLDMPQTLPIFVYLIPLIFLFSVTEAKLYGIAIILYAIVPLVRLTNLSLRHIDRGVIEAADAFGMTERQKLWGVQMPLALPTIMAGVN